MLHQDNQDIIMIRVIIKVGIDWIVEIEGHHSEVEISMDRIIEEDHNMSVLLEMTLEQTISEKCKILEVRILEVDIEGIIAMITLEEVEVGLEKDNIQVISAEMTEVVVVGLGRVES